jgi:hypothetical protein
LFRPGFLLAKHAGALDVGHDLNLDGVQKNSKSVFAHRNGCKQTENQSLREEKTTALTPALSPRRGGILGHHAVIRRFHWLAGSSFGVKPAATPTPPPPPWPCAPGSQTSGPRTASACSYSGRRFPLSPGERAGVRAGVSSNFPPTTLAAQFHPGRGRNSPARNLFIPLTSYAQNINHRR